MLKRILVLLIICSTIICGTACEKTPYDIIEKNGKHYISFNTNLQDKSASPDGQNASQRVIDIPSFASIRQLKEKIENYELEERYLIGLQYYCEDDGLLEIIDLNNLNDVRLPQGLTVKRIDWYGFMYEFTITGELADTCIVSCKSQERYKELFQEYYADCPRSWPLAREFWEEKISDRNATQTFYQTDGGDFKVIKYEICEDNRTLYVAEEYWLASYDGTFEVSNTVPQVIRIFTEENGAFLYMSVRGLKERPPVEWLSSFGVTPYEG